MQPRGLPALFGRLIHYPSIKWIIHSSWPWNLSAQGEAQQEEWHRLPWYHSSVGASAELKFWNSGVTQGAGEEPEVSMDHTTGQQQCQPLTSKAAVWAGPPPPSHPRSQLWEVGFGELQEGVYCSTCREEGKLIPGPTELRISLYF